jgi:hypothetical protein
MVKRLIGALKENHEGGYLSETRRRTLRVFTV